MAIGSGNKNVSGAADPGVCHCAAISADGRLIR